MGSCSSWLDRIETLQTGPERRMFVKRPPPLRPQQRAPLSHRAVRPGAQAVASASGPVCVHVRAFMRQKNYSMRPYVGGLIWSDDIRRWPRFFPYFLCVVFCFFSNVSKNSYDIRVSPCAILHCVLVLSLHRH